MTYRLLSLLILLTPLGCSQTRLTTPVRIPPNAAHTVGGQLLLCAPNDADCGNIQQTTGFGLVITGQSGGNNGNIVLQANSNSTFASVFIPAARLDRPGLIIGDVLGTTTSKAISLRTFGGTEYFSITMGTDAGAPGRITGTGDELLTSATSSLVIGATNTFNATPVLMGFRNNIGNFMMTLSNTGGSGGRIITNTNAGTAVNTIDSNGIKSTTLGSGATALVCADTSGLLQISGCPSGATSPFSDATAILFNAATPSRLLRFDLSGFSVGTNVLTPQNASYIIAGTNLSNTFTVSQSVNGSLSATSLVGTSFTGGGASQPVCSDNVGLLFTGPSTCGPTAWTACSPTLTLSWVSTVTVVNSSCAYSQSNKVVHLRYSANFTVGTTSPPSAFVNIGLPVTPHVGQTGAVFLLQNSSTSLIASAVTSGANLETWIFGNYASATTYDLFDEITYEAN